MMRSTAACVHARTHLLAFAAQREGLPLHVAARYQASEAVVAALLAAHPGAAKEKCGVRPLRPHNRLRCA